MMKPKALLLAFFVLLASVGPVAVYAQLGKDSNTQQSFERGLSPVMGVIKGVVNFLWDITGFFIGKDDVSIAYFAYNLGFRHDEVYVVENLDVQKNANYILTYADKQSCSGYSGSISNICNDITSTTEYRECTGPMWCEYQRRVTTTSCCALSGTSWTTRGVSSLQVYRPAVSGYNCTGLNSAEWNTFASNPWYVAGGNSVVVATLSTGEPANLTCIIPTSNVYACSAGSFRFVDLDGTTSTPDVLTATCKVNEGDEDFAGSFILLDDEGQPLTRTSLLAYDPNDDGEVGMDDAFKYFTEVMDKKIVVADGAKGQIMFFALAIPITILAMILIDFFASTGMLRMNTARILGIGIALITARAGVFNALLNIISSIFGAQGFFLSMLGIYLIFAVLLWFYGGIRKSWYSADKASEEVAKAVVEGFSYDLKRGLMGQEAVKAKMEDQNKK
ncbi:MAG TPA: hypothetical protein ENN60_03285 [archaeon]|nr:hypothetical protein [archaeon]